MKTLLLSLVAVDGIEPSYPAYETSTLPLSYTAVETKLARAGGFEPPNV